MKKVLLKSALLLSAALFCFQGFSQEKSSLFSWTGDKNYVSPENEDSSMAFNQSENLQQNWWKDSVFYHIWIKGFADSDGDGCGDINGIRQNLDYIQKETGCDAIWLSPVFECMGKSKEVSTNMHGYDTVDYYRVNDYFGNEEQLESLIKECHERGMKIIFDFVPNHTSPACQWFIDSIDQTSSKASWYMWSKKPVAFAANGNTTNWYHCKENDMNYYGAFGSGMPDLNFRNYEVREEMKNVVRYWLNRGFDGLRVDAVRYLVETPEDRFDTYETHRWFQELRAELDKYSSPKFMVCEDWIENNRETVNKYFGSKENPEFNMVFDFDQGRPVYSSLQFKLDKTDETIRANPSENTCYGTFLGNHDEYENRLGTRMKNDPRKMKAAVALSLLRPTVPFIYYGNEIGQKNVSYGGDMRLRGPFDWQLAEQEEKDEKSVLSLNRLLINFRHSYKELFENGQVVKLSCTDSNRCLCYVIKGKEHSLLCVYNFGEDAVESVSFTGLRAVRSASLVMGDTEAPAIKFGRGAVTVSKMAPVSFRVYLLSESAECIYDDEQYIPGEHYVPVADDEPLHIMSDKMFIRGTMNGWGGTPMTYSENENGDHIWTIILDLEERPYEFKFCNNDTPLWGANWGNKGGGNIKVNYSAGKYIIQFNETTIEWTIKPYKN